MSCRNHDKASSEELEKLFKKYNQYPKQAGRNHMREFLDEFTKAAEVACAKKPKIRPTNRRKDNPPAQDGELQGVQEHSM